VHIRNLRLTEKHLTAFWQLYSPRKQPPNLDRLKICKGVDGTYLQLLVRLCALVEDERAEISSVTDLFRFAATRLLRPQFAATTDAALDSASEIARSMLWDQRRRSVSFADNEAQVKEKLRPMIRAGLLVSARSSPSTGREHNIVSVRFFHDSMAHFLLARALSGEADSRTLRRLAGDPIFRNPILEKETIPRSEAFEFFVELFVTRTGNIDCALQKTVFADLHGLAERYNEHFSFHIVQRALEKPVADGATLTPASYLKLVLSTLWDEANNEVETGNSSNTLFHLYVSVVSALWENLKDV